MCIVRPCCAHVFIKVCDVYSILLTIHLDTCMFIYALFIGHVHVNSHTLITTYTRPGIRPPLNLLPTDCPLDIRYMLNSCWDGDRRNRKSSVECVAILLTAHLQLTKRTYFPTPFHFLLLLLFSALSYDTSILECVFSYVSYNCMHVCV